MKKLALTFSIVLMMGLGASAQSLLGKSSYDESFMDRSDATTPLILPGFGETDDQDAEGPLGTGIAVMLGLGGAYLVGKRRREE